MNRTCGESDVCVEDFNLENQNIKSENSLPNRVLLIDLENCPSQLEQLLDDIDHYIKVVICHAQSNGKIPLVWLTSLAAAITAGKLQIVQMERSGKNSADFGICFTAGALMQALSTDTHFAIVSNDADLDHTVDLLKKHGRTAERIGLSKSTKNKDNGPNATEIQTALALYCSHLITYTKNRPAKTDTLLNSIKNKLKETPEFIDNVYKMLVSTGSVRIEDDKVVYNDSKIKQLAIK